MLGVLALDVKPSVAALREDSQRGTRQRRQSAMFIETIMLTQLES